MGSGRREGRARAVQNDSLTKPEVRDASGLWDRIGWDDEFDWWSGSKNRAPDLCSREILGRESLKEEGRMSIIELLDD